MNFPQCIKDAIVGSRGVIETVAWKMAYAEITSEIARACLRVNIKNNRPISANKLAGQVRDIRANQWHLTGDPIVFNQYGQLIDGQSRLTAIIEAAELTKRTICLGCFIFVTSNPHVVNFIDVNRNVRSDANIMFISGEIRKYPTPSKAARASRIANAMIRHSYNNWRPTSIERKAFRKKHYAVLLKTSDAFSSPFPGINLCPVQAAYAKALYHEDEGRLKEWAEILFGADANGPRDSAGRIFRNSLLKCRRTAGGGHSPSKLIHRKAQQSIQLFCSGIVCKRISPSRKDLYPLPD